MRRYHPSLVRQCLLLTGGLALAGLGVALTTRAGLGTSPISSLPYVFTFFTPLTFGMATFAVNILFVLGQVALLGRGFPALQYAQLGVVLVFGLFIDLGMWAGCGCRRPTGGAWRRCWRPSPWGSACAGWRPCSGPSAAGCSPEGVGVV